MDYASQKRNFELLKNIQHIKYIPYNESLNKRYINIIKPFINKMKFPDKITKYKIVK